jgi:spore coat protein CotH
MRSLRLAGFVTLLMVFGCLWAQAAFADEAAQIYDPSTVDAIELTLPKTSEEELEAHPTENYVEGFLTISATEGSPGTEQAPPLVSGLKVGIRLKGNEGGSFRDLKEGKAAFKIKCNFVKGVKCLGLKKMTLNNMVQDPSMVHETLAYAAFRAAGVPASRTGYAYVKVNGKDFGVYLDLETLDDVSLKRIFGSFDETTQHLYEGEGGHDVTPGEAAEFEVDEGSEDISDLKDLIAAVNGELGEGESWSEHVAPNVDLAEMTKMWAVEKYIDHWDGYSGHAEPFLRPNNYYLFSEPSGRFQMLPWGADQTWIPTKGVSNREVTFEGKGGVLFNKCLEDKACFRQYWEALKSVTTAIATLGPQALAESTATLLAPWQAEEIAHGRPEYKNATEIKEGPYGVDETIEFIEVRQAEAEQWLAANEPPAEGGGETPAKEEAPSSSVAGPLPVRATPAPGSVAIDRLAVAHGAIDAHLSVSSSGMVAAWVTTRTASGRRNVCTVVNRPVALVTATVRCDLSRAARRRLAAHPVRLAVNVTFVPQDGGAAATTSRRFTARPKTPQLRRTEVNLLLGGEKSGALALLFRYAKQSRQARSVDREDRQAAARCCVPATAGGSRLEPCWCGSSRRSGKAASDLPRRVCRRSSRDLSAR